MANENKKINDLVSDDDDDTSELEVLTATVVFDPDNDYASESDAATHSFETSAQSADGDSIAALKSDLQQREESIGNLQYEIEELRARRTGLEKELKARQELTETITKELEQSNHKLAQTISLLKKRDSRVSALESSLEQQSGRLAEAESAVERARQSADTLRAEMEALALRNQEAIGTIDSLNAELAEEKSKRRWAEDAEQAQGLRIGQLEQHYDESQAVVATLQQYVEGRKSSWDRQETDLKAAKHSLTEQRKENARLAREARRTAEQLRKEQAARQKLQAARDDLEADLETARAEAGALKASLASARDSLKISDDRIASLAGEIAELSPALQEANVERQSLSTQCAELQQEAGSLRADLSKLRQEHAAKESLLAEQQLRVDQLTQQVATAIGQAASEARAREELVGQRQLLQEEADRLHCQNDELGFEIAAKDQTIAEQRQDAADLRREFESMSAVLASEQARREAADRRNDELQSEVTALREELSPLRVASARLPGLEKVNAELSGLVSSSEDAIRELRDRNSKTEGYADVLRQKLKEEQSQVAALAAGRDQTAESLAEALLSRSDLGARLETEQQRCTALETQTREVSQRLDDEIRRLSLELDAAENAAAENRTLSEQLTSDLAESASLRRALEKQLAEADEARDREIKGLSKQVAQLRQQIDDYERKISNKDAAINALLTELAHKPESAEDNAAADDVVHRLADRRQHSAEERAGHHEKDRVTRLLVGSIEGQELRFPLFKDKLTIGRTVHNDIQLKAQYVSRRHAVVVTEDDRTRIVDWGSKNGIYVNGRRVSEKMLKNGDLVTVGTAEFRFEERPKR